MQTRKVEKLEILEEVDRLFLGCVLILQILWTIRSKVHALFHLVQRPLEVFTVTLEQHL